MSNVRNSSPNGLELQHGSDAVSIIVEVAVACDAETSREEASNNQVVTTNLLRTTRVGPRTIII